MRECVLSNMSLESRLSPFAQREYLRPIEAPSVGLWSIWGTTLGWSSLYEPNTLPGLRLRRSRARRVRPPVLSPSPPHVALNSSPERWLLDWSRLGPMRESSRAFALFMAAERGLPPIGAGPRARARAQLRAVASDAPSGATRLELCKRCSKKLPEPVLASRSGARSKTWPETAQRRAGVDEHRRLRCNVLR